VGCIVCYLVGECYELCTVLLVRGLHKILVIIGLLDTECENTPVCSRMLE